MTVEGSGQIIRNPGSGSGGGCITSIDRMRWDPGAGSEHFFTVTVGEGETLVIGTWWQPSTDQGGDTVTQIDIGDGIDIFPFIFPHIDLSPFITWPAHYWTNIPWGTVAAGTYDLTLTNGFDGPQGAMVVFHVLATCFGYQARLGG